jgi:hypothetical protein
MCCHVVDGPRSVTLLGFMLDPDDPANADESIVRGILHNTGTDDMLVATYSYAGRWILVLDNGREVVAFTDPAGMRSLYYARDGDAVWCASQPGMLAQLLSRERSPEAMELIDSFGFRGDRERWWPGRGSPFIGIEHLLPNHLLSLTRGTVRRYWPDRNLPTLPPNDAVDIAARMVRGIITSAATRFDLCVAVTAGLDSRLVLAASRDVAHRVTYATVRQLSMPDDHPDIMIPAALLSSLGFRHAVIRAIPFIDPGFASIFRMNTPLAHNHYEADAAAIFQAYGGEKVSVTGSVSEAIRNPRLGRPAITGPTASREMARRWYSTTAQCAERAIEQWRAELGHTYNVEPDVLFYLEQRAANWGAMTQLEFDTAWRDTLALYNCRALIVAILGVEESLRQESLYLRVIERLWPEVLSVPINPHKRNTTSFTRISNRIRGVALRMGARGGRKP